jgi:hypothetical protein
LVLQLPLGFRVSGFATLYYNRRNCSRPAKKFLGRHFQYSRLSIFWDLFRFSPFFAVKIPIREICAICGKKSASPSAHPIEYPPSHLGHLHFCAFLWQSHHQRSH